MPVTKPAVGKGFNVNRYNSVTKKLGRQYKHSTKLVDAPGINTIQRSSEKLNKVRVLKPVTNKPMSMTYGSSSGSKGITRTISKKRV